MAKLNKNFQSESIEELLEFSNGVTQLFQLLTRVENFLPDFYISEDWEAFHRVLKIQEDAHDELKKRLIDQIPKMTMEQRHDF